MITFDSIFAMPVVRSDTPCSLQDGRHACLSKFVVTCAARGGSRASLRKKKILSIFVSAPIDKEEKTTYINKEGDQHEEENAFSSSFVGFSGNWNFWRRCHGSQIHHYRRRGWLHLSGILDRSEQLNHGSFRAASVGLLRRTIRAFVFRHGLHLHTPGYYRLWV